MNKKSIMLAVLAFFMPFLWSCDRLSNMDLLEDLSGQRKVQNKTSSDGAANQQPAAVNSVGQKNLTTVQLTDQQMALVDELPKSSQSSDWELTLINRDNALENELNWPLESTSDGHLLDQRIISHYEEWKAQAEKDGYPMQLISAYRTLDHQEKNYEARLQDYINQGYSKEEAEEMVQCFQQPRGASEHHTGLAIDIISQDFYEAGGSLQRAFAEEPAYQYYLDTMTDYGFILRYKEEKTDITGISFEPWHYRYVGKENAVFMTEHDLTLEEYHALLQIKESQS